MEIVVWACLGMLAYTYVFFPLLLRLRAYTRTLPHFEPPGHLPRVAIVLAAYNEEAVITAKLENICRLDYPKHLLEVWIGSDASTDATDLIIADYAKRYPFIYGIRFDQRTGKAPILNRLVEKTEAEILVLTDADVLFAPDCLHRLVAPFSDPRVGLVSAQLTHPCSNGDDFRSVEQFFRHSENQLKYSEAIAYGMFMGADGGCYALRRNIYTPFPEDRIVTDDLLLTLEVIAREYRALYLPEAVCFTSVPEDPADDFRRKQRIACSNFSTLARLPHQFYRPWTCAGWLFWSHKLLRWFGGFALVGATMGTGFLSQQHWFYTALALTLSIALLLPLLPALGRVPLLSSLQHFVLANYAQIAGFVCWLRGKTTPYWQPPHRVDTAVSLTANVQDAPRG
ncbi:MAG: glycosyltransferase [Chlorobi bacterium]|nr:glycosyltransferase [Chlorobiota bacterium]